MLIKGFEVAEEVLLKEASWLIIASTQRSILSSRSSMYAFIPFIGELSAGLRPPEHFGYFRYKIRIYEVANPRRSLMWQRLVSS